MFTGIFVYLLLFFVNMGMITMLDVSTPLDFTHIIVFDLLGAMAGLCHMRTMLSDPGGKTSNTLRPTSLSRLRAELNCLDAWCNEKFPIE